MPKASLIWVENPNKARQYVKHLLTCTQLTKGEISLLLGKEWTLVGEEGVERHFLFELRAVVIPTIT